ncbi:lysozyme [Rickettsiales bacterium LUAb2]
MQISNKGIDLIKSFEGFSSTVYEDEAGNLTIGYGHLVQYNEENKYKNANLTSCVATQILLQDISKASSYINNLIQEYNIDFTQNQFDALCSLVFNVGSLGNCTIACVKAHDFKGLANKILEYNHVKGKVSKNLTNRRKQEHDLFCEGSL